VELRLYATLLPFLFVPLQIAFCIQWGLLNRDLNIFTSSVNWAISYDLPNETIRSPDKRLVVPYILRRHRRELYKRLEVAMDS